MNKKMPAISAKGAYEALGAAGFPRTYVKRLLPDWWDNALLKTSGGALEFATILKQRLGVDVRFAQNGDLQVLAGNKHARFKLRSNTKENELQAATAVGVALARLALFCTKNGYTALPSSPKELCRQVKDFSGRSAVDFNGLLDFCWTQGIPVLFLKELPKGSKRVTGMALQIDSRPLIVLGLNSPQNARQLFVLAHELAHICLGHVANAGVLVDEGLAAVTDAMEGALTGTPDNEERQADTFALSMLRNGKTAHLAEEERPLSAAELASAAVSVGKARGIDPGHLILSYANEKGDWLNANLALGYFPDSASALREIQLKFIENSALDRLTEENRDHLLSVQGFL